MPEIPTCIVGTKFQGHLALEALAKMRPGSQVLLERDPDNQHDDNAVKCWFLGVFVGYVPRQANPRIAAALDAGKRLTCTVKAGPEFRGKNIDREPSIVIEWETRDV